MTGRGQIEWVNSAKGLTIIAVVLGHIAYRLPDDGLLSLHTIVWGWRIMVFYMIGGFFLSEEKLLRPRRFIAGKLKRLYLPLLAYYVPAVLLHNVLILCGFYAVGAVYGDKVMAPYSIADFGLSLLKTIFFAGREPIVGAMWFVYVLFLALVGLSLISWALRRLVGSGRAYEWLRLVVLLVLAVASSEAANLYGIYIPRFSNVLTAMWLIYFGYKLRALLHSHEFDNPWICLVSLIIVWHNATLGPGAGSIGGMIHGEVTLLTMSTAAALYVVCFIGRALEHSLAGRLLSACGGASFHVMALHLLCFKLGTLLLNALGLGHGDLSSLEAPAQGSILLFLFYLIIGVGLPTAIYWLAKRLGQKTQGN